MAGVGLVARLLLCLYLTVDISLGSNSSSSAARHRLHIGAFFDLDSADGLGTRPAARLAVEEINNSTRYLRDYELVLVNKSTKVSGVKRTRPGSRFITSESWLQAPTDFIRCHIRDKT